MKLRAVCTVCRQPIVLERVWVGRWGHELAVLDLDHPAMVPRVEPRPCCGQSDPTVGRIGTPHRAG